MAEKMEKTKQIKKANFSENKTMYLLGEVQHNHVSSQDKGQKRK